MKLTAPTPCANCARLQACVDDLQTQVEALQAEVARLGELLASVAKNSSTSSKPPSSDIVKPKPACATDDAARSIGGQPGHAKHERTPFPPEQVTFFAEHTLTVCPCCGGALRRNGPLARIVQQVDITQPVLTIEQHTSPEYWCAACQKPYWAAPPLHIEK